MDSSPTSLPPVVAVLVVHEPGAWFEEVLDGLAAQNYPDFATLFLVTADDGTVTDRIKRRLPKAYIRAVPENAGYGATCNLALRLVEGSGFFCFMHDDVALEPDAVTRLIEEVYRSNAGIVGPKLVEWDDPLVLQHVGLGLDRFGEIDPVVEQGELDQEQHDAVRDVFALPSACLLVRADLFRALGGFYERYEFHGEDVELCWRAHLSGARVLVVPAAKARHRERLSERRPDLAHRRIEADNRLTTVATLSAGRKVPLLALQYLVLSIVETVVGVFTRHARTGLASLGAAARAPFGFAEILARRKVVAPLRKVPDAEVLGLQIRGSARFLAFRRHRERTAAARNRARSIPVRLRGARQTSGGTIRFVLTVALIAGSLRLIRNGVPEIGQFAQLPGPRALMRQFTSGWDPTSFAKPGWTPPGIGLLSLAGVGFLGQMGLARTALVIGPVLLGFIGMWRLASLFPTTRARIGAVVTYAAIPLPYAAISTGRWAVLAVYGALPWALDGGRRLCSLADVPGSLAADESVADTVRRRTRFDHLRVGAAVALLVAVVFSFAPVFAVLVALVMVLWAVATLVAGGTRSALSGAGLTALACLVGALLNMPWAASLFSSAGWQSITGTPTAAPQGLGWLRIAGFSVGDVTAAKLAALLYVPVLAAPLVARGWRLTWAARSGFTAVGFFALAVVGDRNALPFRLPEAGVLLGPAAVGVALAAGVALTAFEFDVRGARFGWRQPLGLLSTLALSIGLLPGVIGIFDGGWGAPRRGIVASMNQRPLDAVAGDYRVLWIGDPNLIPLPSRPYERGAAGETGGVATAVTGERYPSVRDQWLGAPTAADTALADALELVGNARTNHAGRLFAPLSIRFVIIPIDDDLHSSRPRSVDQLPNGILAAFERQLDFRSVSSPERLRVFENTSWLPTTAQLDAAAAQASTQAGSESLTAALSGAATPLFNGAASVAPSTSSVSAGSVLLSVGDAAGWELTVDGAPIEPRSAYGFATAFDVPAGTATLRQTTDRTFVAWLQALVWAGIAWLACGSPIPRRRRRTSTSDAATGDPLLAFDDFDRDVPGIDDGLDQAQVSIDATSDDEFAGDAAGVVAGDAPDSVDLDFDRVAAAPDTFGGEHFRLDQPALSVALDRALDDSPSYVPVDSAADSISVSMSDVSVAAGETVRVDDIDAVPDAPAPPVPARSRLLSRRQPNSTPSTTPLTTDESAEA